jgi:AraC-like DNA-binding protein/cbb3-type cytochrome oxidase subunit 3
VAASIFQKKKFVDKSAFIEIKEFVITMGLFLVFIALFYHVVRVTGSYSMYESRLVVYFTMLLMVIYIFVFLVRKKGKINNREMGKLSSDSIKALSKNKYKKVKITEEQLDKYEQKLYRIMNERKIFLDTDLSVVKLSKVMKIPSYHLTQLFSLRIGKNFNQFVNTYRVNFACVIIDSTEDIKIDTLISECGFNSKTSFNRHFKMIMGIAPSEYYAQKSNRIIRS